ncbi:MAG: ATP-binding cassette domain-containing protein, partial [Candidatus Kariarchaeaceae archaeon]
MQESEQVHTDVQSQDRSENPSHEDKISTNQIVLDIQNLTKRFGELIAVNDVSFKARKGEILGVIGPNGSGKTTLFNLISGVLKPDTGWVIAHKIKRSKSRPESAIDYTIKIFESAAKLLGWGLMAMINGLTYLYIDFFGNESSQKKRKYSGEGDDITGKSPDKIVRDYGISRTFQIVRPFKYLDALSNVTVPHVPLQRFSKPSRLRATAMASLLEVDLGEKKS